MPAENPFIKKARGSKLKPFGGKISNNGNKPENPFISRAKIDPLKEVETQLRHAVERYDEIHAEEKRLFQIIDNLDIEGKNQSNRYFDLRDKWNKLWMKLDMTYRSIHTLIATQARMQKESNNGQK